jgi:hypothetical protein
MLIMEFASLKRNDIFYRMQDVNMEKFIVRAGLVRGSLEVVDLSDIGCHEVELLEYLKRRNLYIIATIYRGYERGRRAIVNVNHYRPFFRKPIDAVLYYIGREMATDGAVPQPIPNN